jgi:hypothetical protein
MKGVELYGQVRRAVYVEGMSRREAARRFGIDPRTVAKMLAFSVPPGYRRTRPPARPKLDPFVGLIDRILEEDKGQPAKQQHTSKRIFERLRDEQTIAQKVNANFLSGTATIAYDETLVSLDDINRFIAERGYHCRGEVVPVHLCEPGKGNGIPAIRVNEHQGHVLALSPTPAAVKPTIEKGKANVPPRGNGAKAEEHAGHKAEGNVVR